MKGVEVIGFSHWGCGWFDQILVLKTAKKAVKALQAIALALQDYPVLDDSVYSELQGEYIDSDFEQYGDKWAKTVADFLGLKRYSKKEMTAVLQALHQHSCDYYGFEDAFIDAKDIPKLSHCWEIERLANGKNKIAKKLNTLFPYSDEKKKELTLIKGGK